MFYEITALEQIKCEEITSYKLINNYGYKFKKNGSKYNLKHILKELGDNVDYWEVYNKRFETIDEALEFIQDL